MKKAQQAVSGVITLLIAGLFVFGVSAPAHATPNPAQQGGADGVLFFTEITDGAIYLGNIGQTQLPKTVFWQESGSKVDSVAVTETRIAWSSKTAASGDPLFGKVLISDVALTAGTVTSVAIPGNPSVTSLAADYFAERFYITTNAGDIYSISSDGTDVYLAVSGSVAGTTISNAIKDVLRGLWVDPYNSNLYFCTWGTGNVWKSSITGTTVSTPAVLKAGALTSCDGIGVDPATQQVFLAAVNPSPGAWSSMTQAGVLTTITPSPSTVGGAPSSMFVSHSTQKIYFSTELNVYEMGYNGSSLVSLYSGPNTTNGIQNIAVYYGANQGDIDQVIAAAKAAQNPVVPPVSPTSSPDPSLASTGVQDSHNMLLGIAGLSAISLGLYLLSVRIRTRLKP